MEKIKIRGLVRLSGWMFAVWGVVAGAKGFFDRFLGGEPEANRYAPAPWAFVTRAQWSRYASFELVYGLACLALALLLFRFAGLLPQTTERPRRTGTTLLD
jgi:hypothetical protein